MEKNITHWTWVSQTPSFPFPVFRTSVAVLNFSSFSLTHFPPNPAGEDRILLWMLWVAMRDLQIVASGDSLMKMQARRWLMQWNRLIKKTHTRKLPTLRTEVKAATGEKSYQGTKKIQVAEEKMWHKRIYYTHEKRTEDYKKGMKSVLLE